MKNKRLNVSNLLFAIIFVAVLIFDLVSKHYAVEALSDGKTIDFIPGFMNFELTYNNGAAWNLFDGMQVFLIIVTIFFLLVYLWIYFSKKQQKVLVGIASGLILGGCLGNLYDRMFVAGPFCAGQVRDFLHFQFMNFPIFNIADSCLCVGVVLLAIYFIFIYPKEAKNEKEELEKFGIQLDENGDIYTKDIDKIKRNKGFLKDSLNIRKFMQYMALEKKEKKEKKAAQEVQAQEEKGND